MKKILFVCTGNTCRSPMAERIFNALAAGDQNLCGKVEGMSAGMAASGGEPMAEHARAALLEMRIDAPKHCARALTQDMLMDADWVFTMEKAHLEKLLLRYPEAAGKAHVLKAYAFRHDGMSEEQEFDIPDPYGGDLALYRNTAVALFGTIRALTLRLNAGC